MRKALIGAVKISVALGALALILAFLGFYIVPAFATGTGVGAPYFSAEAPTFANGTQFNISKTYGFQITITNETNGVSAIANATFELGRPAGTLTNYTNTTSIGVSNNTAGVWWINFTQSQLGGAGSYNYTWYANNTAGIKGNQTTGLNFSIAQTSMVNLTFNLTTVNSTGYVNAPTWGAGPQAFSAQINFTTAVSSCVHNNMTVVYTPQMGGIASILANNTCNYTATVTMTDYLSPTDQLYNSTFVINNLMMNNISNVSFANISADIQLVPLGTYGRASPTQKSILGGFAFNDTNIRAIGSYQNITFVLARRGYMPDGLYQCANWNQATVGSNAQACSNWAAATTPMTDSAPSNTTYLNKTITTQNFTFYGYSEPFYNLRPLVKAYGNNSNITTINIINWGNQRAKYFSWVPMVKFNMTSRAAYLPSSDAYADAMYYNVPFFANPTAIEMLAYNLTVNITFASDLLINNRTVGISITPRVIRSGQTVLSGAETPLMPAWSVQNPDSFEGANVTRTILAPTFNTLYYSYNGVNCGPYISSTTVGPGGASSAIFTNSSLAYPCNYNVSYDYTNNEMNLTLPNTTFGTVPLSVLFALAGRSTTGMYSPVYLVNQTFLGGFIPGPGGSPPTPGSASAISFMVKVNNSLSNFTSTTGTDLMVHFLYPKNVTVINNDSSINISVNMGSGFQLWELNDTISAATAAAINASASNDVNTSAAGNSWMMIANETHLWNATTLTYNTTIPVSSVSSMFVNRTFSCSNTTDSFPGSPSNGQNITICFQEFDFNLTSINGWLPNDPKSNVTLNLTATLNVSILNEIKSATGNAGSTNQYNASVSTASAGEIKLGETQVPGFNAANCGSDFSNCSKTVIVDGSVLNSSSYRTGSVILNLASGTHAVSVTYTVPAAAAATTTTSSGGSSSTTVSDVTTGKVTKTFTSISPTVPRTIYESELNGTNTGLTRIDIFVNNIVANVKINVQNLAGKPASITQDAVSANGRVYKFINISKENMADTYVQNATIRFKIDKSWLAANNFSALNVVLKRFTTQWDSLNTSETSEDASFAYYSAVSPGFSVFAVAADKGVATPVAPEQPAQPGQETNQTPPPAQPPAPQYDMTVAYALVAAVVIIGGLLLVGMRKKKSGKKKN